MRRFIRTASAVSILAVLAASCVSRSAHQAQLNKVRGLTASLDQLEQYLQQFEQENRALKAENASYKSSVQDADWIRAQKAKLAKLLAELEKLGGGRAIPGVTTVAGSDGKVGIRIDESVLFASGRAELSDGGKSTLRRIVPLLQKQGAIVRIDGHTDSDPITRSKWASNLHLSAARSLAVAQELHGAGMAYDRLFISGYGPTRPATRIPSEKAKNRRVELYLIKPATKRQ